MRSTQQLRKRRHAATKRQGWGLKQAEGPEGRCLHVPRPLTDAPWMGHTGFPSSSAGKESACNARDQSDPWVGKIPWRRERLPAPVLLPGEVHGQRSLVGSSPWGHKELDMPEHAHTKALKSYRVCSPVTAIPLVLKPSCSGR